MTTDKRTELEGLFKKHGYADFKWINPKEIIVSRWVRMKCTYGCANYGKNASCPPNAPSVSECRQFFDEYTTAVIFHFEKTLDKPEDRGPWSRKVNQELGKLEREVFLSGYQKTFLLFMDCCRICDECAGRREECRNPKMMRPSPEGMAVDVYATVWQYGFPIQVLSDYSQAMNRYAFLLVE
jgi:predicted metal-binding protein